MLAQRETGNYLQVHDVDLLLPRLFLALLHQSLELRESALGVDQQEGLAQAGTDLQIDLQSACN